MPQHLEQAGAWTPPQKIHRINTQPETAHTRGTLSSDLHETSDCHSADHNRGLMCGGEWGSALPRASKWSKCKKEREKGEKNPTPHFPGSRGGPAACPEVTLSCLSLALLCASTALAVLCAWPSCTVLCGGVLLHPEWPLRGERPCMAPLGRVPLPALSLLQAP